MALSDDAKKAPKVSEVEALKKDLAAKNKLLAHQQERLENLRAAKFSLPTAPPKRKGKRDSFCRVVVPDTHGCFIDLDATAAFLEDLEALNPAEIVMLGDHVDCGGFLAQHFTLGYVAEMNYTFEEDVTAANVLLDKIQELAPDAVIHYLEGNHERRVQKWCVTQALRTQQDAKTLYDLFSIGSVLNLSKRGVHWYEQGEFYMDLPLPATIKLGRCHFTHGEFTSKHAAKAHLDKFGGNVVYGHTHRSDSFITRSVHAGVIGAWCPGCLCKIQRLWNHTNLTGWSHGYGLQVVDSGGEFLHINVPIIDNKSYLSHLTQRIA